MVSMMDTVRYGDISTSDVLKLVLYPDTLQQDNNISEEVLKTG